MKKKILLAEDDVDAREIAKIILEINGYRVVEAVNALETIDRTYKESPDLIIMDLSLLPQGGIQTMQHLRKNPGNRNTPMLAFTALSSTDEQAMIIREGFDGVIPKPCRPEEIVEAVRKFLKE